MSSLCHYEPEKKLNGLILNALNFLEKLIENNIIFKQINDWLILMFASIARQRRLT